MTTDPLAPSTRALLKQIGAPLLQDVAYEKMKKLIVSGEISPGDFFSERQMADMLEMSTSPVRAALKLLSSEGFVTISSQRGVSVRTLTVRELNDMFEYRLALESFVVERLCSQPNFPSLHVIEVNLKEQLRSAEQHDIPRQVHLDVSFHMLLCEAYGNQTIIQSLRLLKDRLNQVAAKITRDNAGRSMDSYQEHYQLFELIRAGDKVQATRLLAEHLEFARQFFFKQPSILVA